MKLILDEWIVREVIDTLYMARTTLLGITGLDSPQEAAKKSANETAITRRISKAIDIIQQSEQKPMPEEQPSKDLEEAAMAQANPVFFGGKIVDYLESKYESFIAGAQWQKEQMLEDAVECEVGSHGEPIQLTLDKYVLRSKGIFPRDKVKVIIVKEEGEK